MPDTIVLDKTGNPAPLGLMGFGMTTILLNLHNAGFIALDTMILSMGIFYGGLAQVIGQRVLDQAQNGLQPFGLVKDRRAFL